MSDQPEQATPRADEPIWSTPSESASRPAPRYRELAIGLAGALLLVVVLVGTAPFWAVLLPWSGAPAGGDAAIEQFEAARRQMEQLRKESTATSAAAARLEQRLGALEARSPPPPEPAPDLGDMRQQIAKLSAAMTELAGRVDTLAKAGQVRAAHDMTDMGLVLALLQVHGAVEAGRPFAAEYEALATLARARPEIAAAAAPLAEPAKTGVASRSVLARRLREQAGAIANTPAEAAGAEPGWADAVVSRLRGLVTIRRIDRGSPSSGPAAAVNAAELALAGGDLAASVAALDKLAGAPGAAAAPWLRMARERLAVETALRRVEALLTARLGGASAAPGSPD